MALKVAWKHVFELGSNKKPSRFLKRVILQKQCLEN